MKTNELREMSDEQLTLTLKETEQNLFRLRMQAQTRAAGRAERSCGGTGG